MGHETDGAAGHDFPVAGQEGYNQGVLKGYNPLKIQK
jgi:hypothetical protein